jgi:hypothetical protein
MVILYNDIVTKLSVCLSFPLLWFPAPLFPEHKRPCEKVCICQILEEFILAELEALYCEIHIFTPVVPDYHWKVGRYWSRNCILYGTPNVHYCIHSIHSIISNIVWAYFLNSHYSYSNDSTLPNLLDQFFSPRNWETTLVPDMRLWLLREYAQTKLHLEGWRNRWKADIKISTIPIII